MSGLEDSWVGEEPTISTRPSLPVQAHRPAVTAPETRANSLEQHGAAHGRAQHGQRQNVAAHAWPERESLEPPARASLGVYTESAPPGTHVRKGTRRRNPRLRKGRGGGGASRVRPMGTDCERCCCWEW